MTIPAEIIWHITSTLELEDSPSLGRAAKCFKTWQETLMYRQAEYFGWDKKGDPVPFLKETVAMARSLNGYSVAVHGPIGKRYGVKVFPTLRYLRTLPMHPIKTALLEFDPEKFPLHRIALNIIGLSPLEGDLTLEDKDRALFYAAKSNAEGICATLLKNGASPNPCFDTVVLKGHVNLARLFLAFNASVTGMLGHATVSGSIEMVDLLLQHGAEDKDAGIAGGAFIMALNKSNQAIAKRLMTYARTQFNACPIGGTYLHLAMSHPEEPWMLDQYDPKPLLNVQNRYGMTPLHWAVYAKNRVGIAYLLSHGADTTIHDNTGKRASEKAPDELKYLFGRDAKRRRLPRI